MKLRRDGFGMTILGAAVLMLLPALAWLQYAWLNQIADADWDRRRGTLQTAAAQLAQEFDSDLMRIAAGLQLDVSIVEQEAWSNYADRYQTWLTTTTTPEVVDEIYFVAAPREGPTPTDSTVLRRWNGQRHQFEPAAWPADLSHFERFFAERGPFEPLLQGVAGLRGRGSSRVTLQIPRNDARVIVTPVVKFMPPRPPNSPPSPADVRVLGVTIVRLDLQALATKLLPKLVQRHLFNEEGQSEYLVAVVAQHDASRVVYESAPGAARAMSAAVDVSTPIFGVSRWPLLLMTAGTTPRPDGNFVVNVLESPENGPTASTQTRALLPGLGHWRLMARHQSGSLEAVVAAARTRNLLLSSGILALLTVAVGLMVVSSRRAARLARQQLEFVAAVSHELRTPVSVISAAAENLADGVVDGSDRVRRYGATIQAEARRLGETVEHVLQMAGMSAGHATPGHEPIAPASLVREALAASRHEIENRGAAVDVDIAPDLPFIVGDVSALRSALQNLIGNAVKYGGSAAWLKVTAGTTASGRLRISVEDRGLGIDADDRRHVFEPFYRGREAVLRQIHGSGLGLHLARRIVEAHGGSIAVESEIDRGSAFTIELPLAREIAVRQSPGTV